MHNKQLEQAIIDNYRRDEETMVLVYAQWCANNGLDAIELYRRVYPKQPDNEALQHAISMTVPPAQALDIDLNTVLTVLSLFHNEELAYIVAEEANRLAAQRRRS